MCIRDSVTPLLKKVEFLSFNDMRAITQTDVFSKISESLVYDKLYRAVEGKININQYGGLKGSSTNHYISKMNDFVLKSLETPKSKVLITLINMKKAFDLVKHLTLIELLLEYDIDPAVVLWISNFLKERKQVVKNGTLMSESRDLSCGTPAGTQLAPLLFVLLINKVLNDISEFVTLNNLKIINPGYLDDLTIVECVNDDSPKTQLLLDIISKSTKSVNMVVNPDKCEFMVIDFSRVKSSLNWSLNFDNVCIPLSLIHI